MSIKSTTKPSMNLSMIFPTAPPIIKEREMSSRRHDGDVLINIYRTVNNAAIESIEIIIGTRWFWLPENNPHTTPEFLIYMIFKNPLNISICS